MNYLFVLPESCIVICLFKIIIVKCVVLLALSSIIYCIKKIALHHVLLWCLNHSRYLNEWNSSQSWCTDGSVEAQLPVDLLTVAFYTLERIH